MPAPSLVDPERRYLRDRIRYPHDEITAYVIASHASGLSVPQISQVLALAQSNVARDQSRALAKLRSLARHGGELGPVARAWSDALQDHILDDDQSEARDRVLGVMREARSGMSCRRIRSLARVRMALCQRVLADGVAVGLVRAAVSGKHRSYMLARAHGQSRDPRPAYRR